MSHLTSEDLKWIQSCTANDTIIFTNSKSDLADTLIVESSSAENKKCQFNFSPFCWRNKYTAQGLVEINIIHKGLLYDGNDLFIEKLHDSIPCTVSWNIMRLIADEDYIYKNHIDDNYNNSNDNHVMTLSKVSINGIDFDDCIIGSLDNCHLHDAARRDSVFAYEIIWSKKYGLLQYKTDEDIYTRIDLDYL